MVEIDSRPVTTTAGPAGPAPQAPQATQPEPAARTAQATGTARTARGAQASPAAAADDWVRCGRCATLVYGKRFARGLRVCPECGWHARLTARQRLDQLLDPGAEPLTCPQDPPDDPLGFADLRPYPERLAEARHDTGLDEAVVVAAGSVGGRRVVAAAMDFDFLGGSLGQAVGALVSGAARAALRERVPLLLVTASGGARMQEGVLSLMQMARTAQALAELDEAGIPVLSVVTDPTYGGVAASFATLADVILAEPGARLGFAGPRVIRQTIGAELPEGFQSAEYLLEHGLVDDVVARGALRDTVARMLGLLDPGARAAQALPERDRGAPPVVVREPERVPEHDPWEAVRLARHPDRPTVLDHAAHLLDGFHELHGDRMGTDCPAVVGGPGLLGGRAVMLIGSHKGGATVPERRRCGFGMATPGGYRKAARLMRMAAKLGLPVVTLVDTPGAHPGPEAESAGQAIAIAENLRLMARLPVPVVTVVTGEGGSGGALALAVADRVLVTAHGVYSVISPEGCAAILWKDAAAAPEAAAALRIQARELLRLGIVDGVVPEPPGGAHLDHAGASALVGEAIAEALDELAAHDPARLVAERAARYDRFGKVGQLRPGKAEHA